MHTGCSEILPPPDLGKTIVDMSIFDREQYGSLEDSSVFTNDHTGLDQINDSSHITAQRTSPKKKSRLCTNSSTCSRAMQSRRQPLQPEPKKLVQVPPDHDYWPSGGEPLAGNASDGAASGSSEVEKLDVQWKYQWISGDVPKILPDILPVPDSSEIGQTAENISLKILAEILNVTGSCEVENLVDKTVRGILQIILPDPGTCSMVAKIGEKHTIGWHLPSRTD